MEIKYYVENLFKRKIIIVLTMLQKKRKRKRKKKMENGKEHWINDNIVFVDVYNKHCWVIG